MMFNYELMKATIKAASTVDWFDCVCTQSTDVDVLQKAMELMSRRRRRICLQIRDMWRPLAWPFFVLTLQHYLLVCCDREASQPLSGLFGGKLNVQKISSAFSFHFYVASVVFVAQRSGITIGGHKTLTFASLAEKRAFGAFIHFLLLLFLVVMNFRKLSTKMMNCLSLQYVSPSSLPSKQSKLKPWWQMLVKVSYNVAKEETSILSLVCIWKNNILWHIAVTFLAHIHRRGKNEEPGRFLENEEVNKRMSSSLGVVQILCNAIQRQ